jgi:acylphosphatase
LGSAWLFKVEQAEMDCMDLWEFVLWGREDLHGIQLREAVKKLADEKKLVGTVQNEKSNGSVIVRFYAENEEQAKTFFEKILEIQNPLIEGKIDKLKSEKRKVVFSPEEKNLFPQEFKIKREDELSEMVWALQGAGKVFAIAEEQREKRHEQKLKQALEHGMAHISSQASELKSNQKSARYFILLTVEQYLREATAKNDLITNLYDLYYLCDYVNRIQQAEKRNQKEPEMQGILDRILGLCGIIQEKLAKEKNNKMEGVK